MFLRPHDLFFIGSCFFCFLSQLHLGWCRGSIYHFSILPLRRLCSPASLFGYRQAPRVPFLDLIMPYPSLRLQTTWTVFDQHALSGFGVCFLISCFEKKAVIHTRRASIACGWGFLAFLCILEWKSSLSLTLLWARVHKMCGLRWRIM
jgi:hypothetical protein